MDTSCSASASNGASAAKSVGRAKADDTKNSQLQGLTGAEARTRLAKFWPKRDA